MKKTSLKFKIKNYYEKAKKIAYKGKLDSINIRFPTISLNIKLNPKDKKIAQEIIIRLKDKRVLNSKECCNKCVENAIKSLQEIRKLFVDKQVEINDMESPLFLLIDFANFGIKEFLTYTEFINIKEESDEYFESLAIIRNHLLRIIDEISKIAELPANFGYRFDYVSEWEEKIYIKE